MSSLKNYMVEGYLPTIGIECHVQLKTKTKLFARVDNDARKAAPNTLVSHICFGMPGALPVLNEEVINLASRAAFALGTKPSKFSKFDRKNYFYPDLPKGYQITQFDEPIILGGSVEIEIDGKTEKVGITRAHLEEDAGKSSHPTGRDYSLVDLNRAGTPLLEIVSEPDMHTSDQAKAYAKELYLRMRYADVSDANLFYGNMRFDVNVSVSKSDELGTRTETKNLNSFKAVQGAVDYEIQRQIEILEKGGVIIQETRGWEDATQKTFSQRSKEEAHDYRYFPEPDLPPVVLTQEYIDEIQKTMPTMPDKIRDDLADLSLDSSTISTIVDHIPAGRFMEVVISETDKRAIKKIANWLAVDVQGLVGEQKANWDDMTLDCEAFNKLAKMVDGNEISSTGAKIVIEQLIGNGGDPLTIAKERDLLQVSDESEIEEIVQGVLDANKQAADDVKNGEMKAIGFLVGQVMKESKGKANPQLAQKLIKKILGS
ncbi:MAG: Asp-tRNA(Asn)/Glu-tRNA(Gln) amidotransferase subunit GatB [bacterium]|nr:Asp-tRNA(Asn)/Glu-tRNA(Gln) amidotransferase subunit GatB [bacterium]